MPNSTEPMTAQPVMPDDQTGDVTAVLAQSVHLEPQQAM